MKKFLLFLFVGAVCIGSAANAQISKVGRISTQELIVLMPERDSAEAKLKAYNEDLMAQMEAIQTEFNTKLADYQKKSTTYTDAIRQQKEKELSDIQTRFTEFQETAQGDFQNVQYTMMAPVYTKAQEAIKEVAKENQLLLVLDLAQGGVLYFDEANTVDLLPLVKKKLGITKSTPTPTTPAK